MPTMQTRDYDAHRSGRYAWPPGVWRSRFLSGVIRASQPGRGDELSAPSDAPTFVKVHWLASVWWLVDVSLLGR